MAATWTVGTAKTYSMPQDAIDAIPSSHTGRGVDTVEVYAGGVTVGNSYEYRQNVDAYTGFTGQTANDYIHVVGMVPSGGLRATGIVIVGQPTGATMYCLRQDGYGRATGISITLNGANGGTTNGIHSAADPMWTNVMVYDIGNTTTVGTSYGFRVASSYGGTPGARLNNCVAENIYNTYTNGGAYAVLLAFPGSTSLGYINFMSILNVRTAGSGSGNARGIYMGSSGTTVCKNVVVGGVDGSASQPCFYTGGGTLTCYNCVSEDGTADDFGGSNNQVTKSPSTDVDFVSVTVGSENIHITAGSCCENAGLAVTGCELDIEGNTRADPPEIGCVEIVEEEPPPDVIPGVPQIYYRQMLGR